MKALLKRDIEWEKEGERRKKKTEGEVHGKRRGKHGKRGRIYFDLFGVDDFSFFFFNSCWIPNYCWVGIARQAVE